MYEDETGLYYLRSRFYNHINSRFINIDTIEALSSTSSYSGNDNLLSYCDNDPVNALDEDGAFGILATALLGFEIVTSFIKAAIITTTVILTAIVVDETAKSIIQYKNNRTWDPDPYRRPGQKKQGRENKGKARKQEGFEPRNNKRNRKPAAPKHHTPGREHRKY